MSLSPFRLHFWKHSPLHRIAPAALIVSALWKNRLHARAFLWRVSNTVTDELGHDMSYLKVACQHCKGHIEYPSGLAGQSVECPHCKQTLTLPPPPIPLPLPVINRAEA